MKSEVIPVRWSKREVAIVERRAKAQGLTVSQYVRGAVMLSAVLDGDMDAFKLVGQATLAALARKASGNLEQLELEPA